MRSVRLAAVVSECNRLLQPSRFQDWDAAHNGLQVENRGTVTRIAATVDASLVTVRQAIEAGANLLLVHHGLFWSPRVPWTGPQYELVRLLVTGNLAVYSAHLPLDAHPRLGNNARIAAALGWRRCEPFFECRGQKIGVQTRRQVPRDELVQRLREVLGGEVKLLPGGPAMCRRIGLVSGGAGAELKQAADEGVDTFITGEGPHWTYALAEEVGINVLFGGHYATETFGVKALAGHLAQKFGVPWLFLDHPTGL